MDQPNVKTWDFPLHFAGLALVASLGNGLAHAQAIDRVSVSSSGIEANGTSEVAAVSADGRFVAFLSAADNLVAGDTNQSRDVFVRDRQSGTTERVSVSSAGVEGNLQSLGLAISADGRFVAFQSYASNLVAGDTNGTLDIFVRDRLNGTTEIVSVSSSGAQGNGLSDSPSISADGRFIAFSSSASNLVAFDFNSRSDVFVRDRLSGTTMRVSVSTTGSEGLADSISSAISADGRFVAFQSHAWNLVPNGNAFAGILVRDTQLNTTERVSVGPGGIAPNQDCASPSISGNGRFVAFYSRASNLVPGVGNGWLQVFVHDRQTGANQIASVSSSGVPGDGSSRSPSLSSDARFVAFHSIATNLIAADTNLISDTFVHDRSMGTTVRVSVDNFGTETAEGHSGASSISADGRIVAFPTPAPSLVAGDTNGVSDIFVYEDRTPPQVVYCLGDGSGTQCPCGNSAQWVSGCPNSIHPGGARLGANGLSSLANDRCVLAAFGMPNSSVLYFQGTTREAGGAGVAFGDGLRCAGGSIVRLKTALNSGGSSRFPAAGDPSLSVQGTVTSPGLRTYQAWYRNAAAFCTNAPFNFTNGVEITWVP